ncbi:intradiol ring-cleavage dioxygenase [Subtercola frigoramans]|uniref:Protocatechuate 3,4-dioxygenase beta subunit n=1 Tax=Subtercola frigoramans TaxID=120298 RepID=A0ABS2L884_9MICO|nr:intradiol ring-cleavage dioxygenase [Subtercola frigoramans]MBM7473194.1 protocatechuate 3,4-dioxygenase beta subunit [Subtercola frigoramans]
MREPREPRETPEVEPTVPVGEWREADGTEIDEEDRGLVYDIRTLVNRRRALGLFGGIAATTLLAACSSTPSSASVASSAAGTASATATSTPSASASATAEASGPLTEVPDETAGPYPGDGSNGANVLDDSGVVRSDIRSSFGSSTTTAAGVPLSIQLTVRDAATGNALTGAAVYLWHCNRDGNYSLYSQGVTNENYLRGVQEVDSSGTVTFTSIFPACYSGRWPHIHFEVYSDVATAVASGPIVKTSQIALPKEACDLVYATTGYEKSVSNLASTSLARDNVFGNDGGIYQIASMSGSVASGYTAALTVGV